MKKLVAELGRLRRAGTWMVLAGGSPQHGQAQMGELTSAVVGPCWGSLRTRRHATLMDRLDRRGGIFLDWAFAAFGDGELRGSGELPEDSSSSVGRSMSSGATTSLPLPGREARCGRGGSRDYSVRPASNRFVGAHFPLATGSLVCAIRPSVSPAPLVLLPSLVSIGGTGLQGLGSLDC